MKKLSILFLIFFLIGCNFEQEDDSIIQKWENGIVYYQFRDEVSDSEQDVVRKAMDIWEDGTIVEFIEASGIEQYICKIGKAPLIDDLYRPHAILGQHKDSEMTFIEVGYFSVILHELGHVLGLIHEHQRPDRDEYVEIYPENMIVNFEHNFELFDNPLYEEESLPYNYNSIMHYTSFNGSKNGNPVIITTNEDLPYIIHWNKKRPADIDYAKVNLIYE